jgi:hypothetical protein
VAYYLRIVAADRPAAALFLECFEALGSPAINGSML